MHYKVGQVLLQSSEAFLYYKARQVVSQSRVLQSRAGIAIWGKYNFP